MTTARAATVLASGFMGRRTVIVGLVPSFNSFAVRFIPHAILCRSSVGF